MPQIENNIWFTILNMVFGKIKIWLCLIVIDRGNIINNDFLLQIEIKF